MGATSQPADGETHLLQLLLLLENLVEVSPDHPPYHFIAFDFPLFQGANVGAIAQHHHPVGDRLDFCQTVGDEDDRHAVGTHRLEAVQQQLRLGGRQGGGRLVEEQHPGVSAESTGEGDQLALAVAEFGDRSVEGNVEGDLGKGAARCLGAGRPVEKAAAAARLAPEKDILENRQRIAQLQLLGDAGDAAAEGIGGAGEADRLAIDQDLAAIGVVDATQDLHQGALTGAIFADHRQDLAPPGADGHIVESDHSAEPLADGARFDHSGGIAHLPSFLRMSWRNASTSAWRI